MTLTTVDFLTRRSAAALISGYQRHLSPKKGFCCAYRVLHGGESCSQYIKTTILHRGLLESISLSRQRFKACKDASNTLKIIRSESPEPKRNKEESPEKSSQDCANALDAGSVGCDSIDCGISAWDGCSSGFHGFDCGAVDCSGVDCGFLDCGACSW